MNVISTEWKGQQMDSPIIFRSNVVLKSYVNIFSSVVLQQHLSKEPIEISFLGYIMTWFLDWILHVTPIAYSFEGTIYLLPSYSFIWDICWSVLTQ